MTYLTIESVMYIFVHINCVMKNVTLSIPDELLKQSREYALRHGTTLNAFIRDLLRRNVASGKENAVDNLLDLANSVEVDTDKWKWNRNEIYDRKVFS